MLDRECSRETVLLDREYIIYRRFARQRMYHIEGLLDRECSRGYFFDRECSVEREFVR